MKQFDLLSTTFMIVISMFISYYVTWNVMLDENMEYNHLNRVYHSLLMGFIMGSLEIAMMLISGHRQAYLYILLAVMVSLSMLFWTLIRKQTFIGEDEFYKGMIQHHDAALFMARRVLKRNDISSNLRTLANNIILTQTKEINDMKTWLSQS